MIADLLTSLTVSLGLTLALESGFFLLVGKRNRRDLLLVLLVNVITNPAVVLLHWLALSYTDWSAALVTIPLELFAVIAEGAYYKRYGQTFKRPFLFSLAANAFSFGIGLLIQLLI